MGRTYPKLDDGEWVSPVHRNYRMQCCDCGLVHRINFRIRNGRVELQAFRDNRSTAACRRSKKKREKKRG